MSAASAGAPDWWSLFTRMPFMGAGAMGTGAMGAAGWPGGPGGAGAASLQQFVGACERHMALMQTLADELGQGGAGAAGLFERLRGWQRAAESGGADPFGLLRELGAFGIPAAPPQLENLGRLASLQSRALLLQARMLEHGAEIARDAMERFAARAQQAGATLPSLYDAWIDCAEEAYAARVHREDYCQTQAELTNTLSALRLEQQTQFETWARALDLPTREEVNALIRRIRALEKAQAEPESGTMKHRTGTKERGAAGRKRATGSSPRATGSSPRAAGPRRRGAGAKRRP